MAIKVLTHDKVQHNTLYCRCNWSQRWHFWRIYISSRLMQYLYVPFGKPIAKGTTRTTVGDFGKQTNCRQKNTAVK